MRANWLKKHHLAPFDNSVQGRERWETILQSIPAECRDRLKESIQAEEKTPHVLQLNRNVDEGGNAKDLAMIYFRCNHDFASASDYIATVPP
jgi:hypothetical protein